MDREQHVAVVQAQYLAEEELPLLAVVFVEQFAFKSEKLFAAKLLEFADEVVHATFQ